MENIPQKENLSWGTNDTYTVSKGTWNSVSLCKMPHKPLSMIAEILFILILTYTLVPFINIPSSKYRFASSLPVLTVFLHYIHFNFSYFYSNLSFGYVH